MGGTNSNGMIFKINTNGSGFANVYSFAASGDGINPRSALVCISNVLYGTTYGGGANYYGILYKINTDGTGYQNVHNFSGSPDGQNPEGVLIVQSNILYGTTSNGGGVSNNGSGTVFNYDIEGGSENILYVFTNTPDGANPYDGLLLVKNSLYGITRNGGFEGYGTLFSLGLDGSRYNILHNFQIFDGENPNAGLIVQGNSIYGTTENGGIYGNGNVFEINTNGAFNDIYDFTNFPDGDNPESSLSSP